MARRVGRPRKGIGGRAWKLDRLRESREKHEVRYKKKSRGLAYASQDTRQDVASKGGKARWR